MSVADDLQHNWGLPVVYSADAENVVTSLSGAQIDTSGSVWRIDATSVVNWGRLPRVPPFVCKAVSEYIKYQIRSHSPRTVTSEFNALVGIFDRALPVERDHATDNGDLGLDYFTTVRGSLDAAPSLSKGLVLDRLGSYRRFYLWATDACIPGFCPDTAAALEDVTIGQHATGVAVLRNDPKEGPLDEVEFLSLSRSLRAALDEQPMSIPLRDAVICMLSMSFGIYPAHLHRLDEADYTAETLPDGSVRHFLRIPRIKKRAATPRAQWKQRELDPEYGRLIAELIKRNAETRASDPLWRDDLYDKALFHGWYSPSLSNTPHSRDCFRITPTLFNVGLARVVTRLGIRGRDGDPLSLTPRRLRYTYAARLVDVGATPHEVAEALDHSSTKHVLIYFDGRQRMLRRMERSSANLEMAMTAKLFQGEVVRSEEEAPRGRDPKSRIPWVDKENVRLLTLGNCGKFDFCGLARPKACYTCGAFRPWLDGPHEAVLQDLEREHADKVARGLPPQVTSILAEVMVAVSQVILACEAMRALDVQEAAG